MPKIGGHVSAAVSLDLSIDRALDIGAECTQIFISPPQSLKQIIHSEEEVEEYRRKAKEGNIGPSFTHGAYLLSLASDSKFILKNSIEWLVYAQKEAEKLGLTGTIFHVGSCKERPLEVCTQQVIEAVKQILNQTGKANLVLENSAGAGNLFGDQISELGAVIKAVKDPRLKICLDTQHLFASGYAIQSEIGLENLLSEVEREVGLENLVAIHCNDSKTEFNSKKDRHENLGEGFIGVEAFKLWINHPKLQNIPFILEVPGFADKGPDKENIEKLKSLIKL